MAFLSGANNLVPGDSNDMADVFVRDMLTGSIAMVSVNSLGGQANDFSLYSSISADGRYVAFESAASNLCAGDANGTLDVFVRDLALNVTTLISSHWTGMPGGGSEPSISADGRYVAFCSNSDLVIGDTNGRKDVFVRDLATGATRMVSIDSAGVAGDSDSWEPSISKDGRRVAFTSWATNLVVGDTNNRMDVFVRDLSYGTTTRVSVDQGGAQRIEDSLGASISADGRSVAFNSGGSFLAADTNGLVDVYVRDLVTGHLLRASVSSTGAQANGGSYYCTLSADGHCAAFLSAASNLVTQDTNGGWRDVFVHDILSGTTTLVTVNSFGVQAEDTEPYDRPSITADGRYVTFESDSPMFDEYFARLQDVFRHEVKLANTISGKVTIPGFAGGLPKTWVDFSLEPVGGGDPIPIYYVKIKDDGSYSFSTGAQGSFRILARAPGSLVKAFASTISLGSATLANVDFTLTLGDCDGNNYIGTDDYLILNSAFDTNLGEAGFDPRADLNGDGYVGTDDYLLLNAHFDESGD